MAHGILPAGGWLDRQPQGVAEIDWGNTAAEQTGILWTPIQSHIGAPISSSGIGSTATPAGIGATNASSANFIRFPDAVAKSNDFTVAVQFRAGSILTGTQVLFARANDLTAYEQNWVLGIDGPGALRFSSDADSYAYIQTSGITSGRVYTVVGTVSGSREWRLYVNGVLIGTRQATADPRTTGPQQTRIGQVNSGNYPLKGGTAVTFAWAANRAVSPGQAASISANPWQLFRDDTSDALIFDMGAGGAGSHTLTGANSTQSNTGTTAAIAQAHALAGANSVQANTGGTGSIGSDITLAGAAGSSANMGSVGAIGQVHVLVGAASAQANGGSTGTITQVHALAGANATQGNVGSTAALGETVITLAGSAGSSANTGSVGAITQVHALVGAASVQDNVASASAIVQAHMLAGAAGVSGNVGSVGAVVVFDYAVTPSPYIAYVPAVPHIAYVPAVPHIAYVPAVSSIALRGL